MLWFDKVHELQKFITSESGSLGERNVNYCLMGTKTWNEW